MVSEASNDGAPILVYEGVLANKSRYSQSEEAAREKIRREVEASGARPTLPMFESWFADRDVETFNRDVVDAGLSKRLNQLEPSPAFFDRYMVTDEIRFRRSLGLITGLPFSVVTSVEFAGRFS